MSAESRRVRNFWRRVTLSDGGCWMWTGGLTLNGYGQATYPDGRQGRAHRIAYELTHGRISRGLEIDHLCRNRRCVRPEHLDVVTHKENVARGKGPQGDYPRTMSPPPCPVVDVRTESFYDGNVAANVIGELVHAARRQRGMTLDALAAKVGSTKGSLSRIEHGYYEPRIALLRKIAYVLGVSVHDLINHGRRKRRAA